MRRIVVLVVAAALALVPGYAFADDGESGLLLRINGDVLVPAGETVNTVIVIDGNARIEGTVRNDVTVINGDAVVSGSVEQRLTVVSGDITLANGARVQHVTSIRGDITRDSGASVTGRIRERDDFSFLGGVAALFSLLFWLGMTVATVVAGLVFAAVGGRQLTDAARAMTEDAVGSILGVVGVWVGLPILAVLVMATVIGLPLGLGLLLFLLPVLWFLGYIVAGARLGGFLVGLAGRESGGHPFLATFLGLLLLQLAVLVPVIGALAVIVAGIWGSGALGSMAFRAAGGKGVQAPTTQSPSPPMPAV